MKFFSALLALVLWPCLQVSAQVTVEVKLAQDQFLSGEALPVAVRIINRSGQTLRLGSDPDWLTFSVEAVDDFIVVKTSDVPVVEPFTVESSQMATKRVDLAPHFILSRPGRYRITATVRVKDWDMQVNGGPATFDVVAGAKLWSREFGVPVTSGASNQPPEVRKYTLEQANYLRSQLRLYLQVTDESETKVFKVVAIGPMVSFGQPDAQLDRASNLHVLYQNGPRSFSYTVCNPDGNLLLQQTYDYAGSRPRLQTDDRGNILVTGGQRRPMSSDLPPPPPPVPPAPVAAPKS